MCRFPPINATDSPPRICTNKRPNALSALVEVVLPINFPRLLVTEHPSHSLKLPLRITPNCLAVERSNFPWACLERALNVLMSMNETDGILSGAIFASAKSFKSTKRRNSYIQLSLPTEGPTTVFPVFYVHGYFHLFVNTFVAALCRYC